MKKNIIIGVIIFLIIIILALFVPIAKVDARVKNIDNAPAAYSVSKNEDNLTITYYYNTKVSDIFNAAVMHEEVYEMNSDNTVSDIVNNKVKYLNNFSALTNKSKYEDATLEGSTVSFDMLSLEITKETTFDEIISNIDSDLKDISNL